MLQRAQSVARLTISFHLLALGSKRLLIPVLVYNSIIQPKYAYAISIRGYTSRRNLNKIQRLLNRAAIIITWNHDYTNTRGIGLVKTLKWMCISQRRYYFMLIVMFKSIRGLLPNYLCDVINMQIDIVQKPIRYKNINDVYVPYGSLEC